MEFVQYLGKVQVKKYEFEFQKNDVKLPLLSWKNKEVIGKVTIETPRNTWINEISAKLVKAFVFTWRSEEKSGGREKHWGNYKKHDEKNQS